MRVDPYTVGLLSVNIWVHVIGRKKSYLGFMIICYVLNLSKAVLEQCIVSLWHGKISGMIMFSLIHDVIMGIGSTHETLMALELKTWNESLCYWSTWSLGMLSEILHELKIMCQQRTWPALIQESLSSGCEIIALLPSHIELPFYCRWEWIAYIICEPMEQMWVPNMKQELLF